MKVCTKCLINKDLTEYSLSIEKDRFRYKSQCKSCRAEYDRKYSKTNNGIKIRQEYREKHRKEAIRATQQWRKDNQRR